MERPAIPSASRATAGCSAASASGRLGGSSVSVSAVLQVPLTTSPPSALEAYKDIIGMGRAVASEHTGFVAVRTSRPGGGAMGGAATWHPRSNKPGGADAF